MPSFATEFSPTLKYITVSESLINFANFRFELSANTSEVVVLTDPSVKVYEIVEGKSAAYLRTEQVRHIAMCDATPLRNG